MHSTENKYFNQPKNESLQLSVSNSDIQIFKDPVENLHLKNNFDLNSINTNINLSDDNDENHSIDQDLTNSIDPIERLLMSNSVSPIKDDVSDLNNHFDPSQFNYLQNQFVNSSPTYNYPVSMDTYFLDNDSIYDMYQDLNCDSLHDYSSVSNIIYTNKIKDKLRKKRNSSTDLSLQPKQPSISSNVSSLSSLSLTSSCKVCKNNSTPTNSNPNSKRYKLRSKSVGAIISQKADISNSNSNEPIINTTKAINPFYHPPEILKHLSNT